MPRKKKSSQDKKDSKRTYLIKHKNQLNEARRRNRKKNQDQYNQSQKKIMRLSRFSQAQKEHTDESASLRKRRHSPENLKEFKERLNPKKIRKLNESHDQVTRTKNSGYSLLADNFEAKIRESMSHVCNCCGRLWFSSSMKKIKKSDLLKKKKSRTFVETVFCVEQNEEGEFCFTCGNHIMKGKIPKLCLNNGLQFPHVHKSIKKLNRIEERLVSPFHVFQTIWPVMGPNGQYKGKGGIVNVPINFDNTVSSLPRTKHDASMFHIRLARKLEYQHDYMSGFGRPKLIYNAAKQLVSQPLFIEEGIHLTSNWETSNEENGLFRDTDESMDYRHEETLLVSDNGIRMAPAEGYKPESILLKPEAEYLAFPKIFGGSKLNPMFENKPILYCEIAKSMAMRYDRRVAERSDFLLFMAKKIELLKLQTNINICLRKKILNKDSPITAQEMLDQSYVDGLIQHNDGYRVLQNLRNSNAHWKQEKAKLMAMIRQFGLPTLFLTLSAADTKWPELLVHLKKT